MLFRSRLILADAQGTIWHGDAVAVLTGGPGSRDARALPGRLGWRLGAGLGLKGVFMRLVLTQDCCMNTPVMLQVQPGIGRVQVDVKVQAPGAPGAKVAWVESGEVGHWPAAWLGGLGAPWNALDLSGVLRVDAQGLQVSWAQGRMRLSGRSSLALDNAASRLSTLDRLGSYRLDVQGDAEGLLQLNLMTLDGALQLRGQGTVNQTGLHFQGEAQAREAERAALDNLLTIIGRRAGDRSVISIG